FVAPRVEVVADADAVLDRLSTADLRDVGFVEEPIEPFEAVAAADSPLDARIAEYESNRVRIDASAPRGGLLVLTDQYFPGWKATLDGTPVEIRRADYLFRGVRLPPGRHRVEMVYRPPSVAIGFGGTLAAAVLIATGVVLSKRSAGADMSV